MLRMHREPDTSDQFQPLGPPLPRPVIPKENKPHNSPGSPNIIQGEDGKLRTNIPENEAANSWTPPPKLISQPNSLQVNSFDITENCICESSQVNVFLTPLQFGKSLTEDQSLQSASKTLSSQLFQEMQELLTLSEGFDSDLAEFLGLGDDGKEAKEDYLRVPWKHPPVKLSWRDVPQEVKNIYLNEVFYKNISFLSTWYCKFNGYKYKREGIGNWTREPNIFHPITALSWKDLPKEVQIEFIHRANNKK